MVPVPTVAAASPMKIDRRNVRSTSLGAARDVVLERIRASLDQLAVDDPAGPRIEQDPVGIAVPAAEIGKGAAIAFDDAHAVEPLGDDGASLAAAYAIPDPIDFPIGLRIPIAAEIEAESR